MKSLLLVFAFAFSPQVLADDSFVDSFVEDMEFQPSATDGLGRMFAYSQSLAQALDTMSWYIMFGGNIAGSVPYWQKTGPVCSFDKNNTSSLCRRITSDAILRDAFKRDKRRRFHTTLTHLHHIRLKALKSIDAIGQYYSDKSWGTRHARCLIYGYHNDIKQDWPSFLTAYRDDRRGLSKTLKEHYGLYFAYARRAYSDYLNVMDKLSPDLKKLCEAEND